MRQVASVAPSHRRGGEADNAKSHAIRWMHLRKRVTIGTAAFGVTSITPLLEVGEPFRRLTNIAGKTLYSTAKFTFRGGVQRFEHKAAAQAGDSGARKNLRVLVDNKLFAEIDERHLLASSGNVSASKGDGMKSCGSG